jgi:hypothetical protein
MLQPRDLATAFNRGAFPLGDVPLAQRRPHTLELAHDPCLRLEFESTR